MCACVSESVWLCVWVYVCMCKNRTRNSKTCTDLDDGGLGLCVSESVCLCACVYVCVAGVWIEKERR